MATPAYPLRNGRPEFRNSFVLFLDILGFGELSKDGKGLQQVWAAINDHAEIIGLKKDPAVGLGLELFEVKAFTDNIVLGVPIHDDGEDEFGLVLQRVSQYQLALTLQGYFVRGGLAVGPHYMDSSLVFGPALMEAYELESKKAGGPRVVLSTAAADLCRAHTEYYGDPKDSPQYKALFKDPDGTAYINYLDGALLAYELLPEYKESIRRHRDIIVARLEEFRSNLRVWDKYSWAGRFHNQAVTRLYREDEIDESMLVPPSHLLASSLPFLP